MRRLALFGMALCAACGSTEQTAAPSDAPSDGPFDAPSDAAPAPEPSGTDATAREARVPVVVTTDLAFDDWLALPALALDPRLDLKLLAVDHLGEVDCAHGLAIAGKLLALLGRGDVPIACGPEQPGDASPFPDRWRYEANELMGIELAAPATAPTVLPSAPEAVVAALRADGPPVTVLTLGTLTTVQRALASDAALGARVARLVSMGGALDIGGNVRWGGVCGNPKAEWNFFADPAAAAATASSTLPWELIPQDATDQLPIDLAMIDVVAGIDSDYGRFVHQVLEGSRFLIERGQYFLWDPTAALLLVDRADCGWTDLGLAIDQEPVSARGALRREPGAPPHPVCLKPDKARLLERWLGSLRAAPDTDRVFPRRPLDADPAVPAQPPVCPE